MSLRIPESAELVVASVVKWNESDCNDRVDRVGDMAALCCLFASFFDIPISGRELSGSSLGAGFSGSPFSPLTSSSGICNLCCL